MLIKMIKCYEYRGKTEQAYRVCVDIENDREICIWDNTHMDEGLLKVELVQVERMIVIQSKKEIRNKKVEQVIEYIKDKEDVQFKVVECYKRYMLIDGHKVLYGEMDNMCELLYGNIAKGILDKVRKEK